MERIRQLGRFWLAVRPDRPNFYICWMDKKSGKVKAQSTRTTDLAEAERQLALRYQNDRVLDREDPAAVPLMAILDRYYDEHASKLPSANAARLAIEFFREVCPDISVADFRKKEQRRVADILRGRGASEGYVSRVLSVARAALLRAFDDEELSSVPKFIKLKRGPGRNHVLAPEEVAALFNAARTEAQFLFLLLAVATAARPQAILDLTREQVDFRRNLIDLNPPGRLQTKKRRPILPLPSTLIPWLRQGTAEYFINHDDRPYTWGGWRAILRRLIQRAGVKRASAYTIRHTMATELYTRGVSYGDVKMWLGHSLESMGTTGGYIHLKPEYLQAPRRAIDDYFRELEPLLKRSICAVDLEEQPLPPPLASPEMMESQPELMGALHPRYTPAGEGGREPKLRNVLNELVGVTGFEPATPTSRT